MRLGISVDDMKTDELGPALVRVSSAIATGGAAEIAAYTALHRDLRCAMRRAQERERANG
ncbi:MAG: hypothetical protein FD152_2046 [Xanthobacteraceae bacterium]|nr:MAG: hypothetical protein FD152_2046 [Xanthobacteraceae bacterium]